MKKLLTALVIGVFGMASAAAAAPVGDVFNFSTGEQSRVLIGAEADFVFDRDGKDSGESIESQSYAAKIGYEISKYLTPYVLLGALEGEYEHSGVVGFESDMGFMWGGGISGVLWDRFIEIGYDAKYRKAKLDIGKVNFLGAGVTVPDSSVDYTDWQAALIIAREFDGVRPYAGVKYSDFKLDDLTLAGTSVGGSAEAADNFGIVAGLSVNVDDNMSAAVEGRLLDEKALTLSLTMRF